MIKIFIDFDETIFDHNKMLGWVDNYLAIKYGLAFGDFSSKINDYHDHVGEGYRLYKHREHFGTVNEQWQKISSEISKLVREQNQDFCFPEVHKVIKNLAYKYDSLEILTFGDTEYQNYKISHCKVLSRLKIPVSVVSEPKRKYLARNFPNQKGVLVDDKFPLNLPLGWTHIWINRKSNQKSFKKLNNATWKINSLLQLTDILHII